MPPTSCAFAEWRRNDRFISRPVVYGRPLFWRTNRPYDIPVRSSALHFHPARSEPRHRVVALAVAHGVEEGGAGILHQVPAVSDLGRLEQRPRRSLAVAAAAVTCEDGDRGMGGEPCLDEDLRPAFWSDGPEPADADRDGDAPAGSRQIRQGAGVPAMHPRGELITHRTSGRGGFGPSGDGQARSHLDVIDDKAGWDDRTEMKAAGHEDLRRQKPRSINPPAPKVSQSQKSHA